MIDVFVIVPYTHANPKVVTSRVNAINSYLVSLAYKNIVCYSTVSSWHAIATEHKMNTTFKYWKKHCKQLIACSTRVEVLTLPGWDKSEGVTGEIDIATYLGKPITFIKPVDTTVLNPLH